MNLFEKLPLRDVETIQHYFNWYGDSCTSVSMSNMEYVLRYWAKNKLPLYHIFGEQFIVEKEISFEKDRPTLENEMYEAIWYYKDDSAIDFANRWEAAVNMHYGDEKYLWRESTTYHKLYSMLTHYEQLVDNIYTGPTFQVTIGEKELTVQTGCKLVKMIGKISDLFGIPRELYEQFRIAHSMVLNQKRTKGKLCLSIHPMDYVTMSDNDHNWSSCMGWMDECDGPGDYRLGTIEMMNSEYCVVAYIKSTCDENSELYIGNEFYWNSKKWRQLIMVTPELILGNKQYPYANDAIQGEALRWMRELANQYASYGPYMDTSCNIENRAYNYIDGTRKIYFELDFDYMYNDIYDYRLAYFSESYNKANYTLNLSGPAVCITCGSTIGYNDVDPRSVSCFNCSGEFKCNCCGEYHSEDPYYVDGYPICSYCFENETFTCAICEEPHLDDNVIHMYINTPFKSNFNWRYKINICRDCMDRPDEDIERYFGKFIEVEDRWGKRLCLNVQNLTETGLEILGVSSSTEKYILEIKENAKTPEDVIEIREKILPDYDEWW